jgi:ribosomal protein S27AE
MNNIDIFWIHNYLIRKYMNYNNIENSDEYKKWKQLYNTCIEKDIVSNNIIENLEQKINELDIHNNSEQLSFYLVQAVPLIEEYQHLKQNQHKISFINSHQPTKEESNSQENMKKILKNYFNLIQTYFPEEYKNNEWDKIKSNYDLLSNLESNLKSKCLNCNNDCSNFVIHDNHFVCEKCGYVSSTIHTNTSYKDIDRVNISSKYTYDKRVHFRDCINQFQGKQNASIPKKLYDDMIEQLLNHGLIPENYKELDKIEAFKNVNKEHILLFLREIEQTKHYEDIVLIHHQITGKPAPDISHLENALMADFDILVETYEKKYKNSERKNFINTQYVLFQLLKKHKYPCKKEDFNMLKTVDRKYYHDVICSELFKDIGWSFTALF